ncbi:MAG: glycosyltransferase family 39 protein [Myxococcota bacterium]
MARVQKPSPTPTSASPDPARGATRSPASDPDRRAWLLLGIAVALLYGLGLGRVDLWAPDEPRYGAIAEELRSGRHGAAGWVLLHLNDEPYTQKPPLYFWLAAAAGAPGGRVDELAARLPSAVAGLVGVFLTAFIARVLVRDPRAALVAGGLLATSWRFVFTARRAQLDVLLTTLELVAIALFAWLEWRRGGVEHARRRPLAIAGLHGSLGLAALVKGPVAWLPLLIFAAYLAAQRRARSFRAIAPAWAWLLSLAPLGLWITAATALAPSGFAREAVGENVFGRFFAGTSHARPIYYFLYQLPVEFLPWTLLLPFAAKPLLQAARIVAPRTNATGASGTSGDGQSDRDGSPATTRDRARFLLAWILVPFVFFSLSAGKRGLYLLPILPALAIAATLAGPLARSASESAIGAMGTTARAWRRLSIAIALVGVLELALFGLVWPGLDARKSPRPIAEAAARHSARDEAIGVYGLSPIEGGIAYYGDRRIASLRDEAALRDFLAAGGRLVVLRARHQAQIGARLGLQPLATFRSGDRQLVLAHGAAIDPRRSDPPRDSGERPQGSPVGTAGAS